MYLLLADVKSVEYTLGIPTKEPKKCCGGGGGENAELR